MKKNDLFHHILLKENKYSKLLWYARTNPSNSIHAVAPNGELIDLVQQNLKTIENNYPLETSALYSEEQSQWAHGFHSGVVAAMRYVLTLNEYGVEQAEEEFPMLDS